MFHPIKPRDTAKLFLLFWLGAAVLEQQAAPQNQNPSPATIRVRTYLVLVDELVGDFLETSGIVFGIKDHYSPAVRPFSNAEQPEILHYLADKTGGQYYSAPPEAYAAALDMILMQLHFRYELGFKPRAIDGKRHALKVELTSQAQAAHTGVQLRFRPEYIPVCEEPAWAH